ncbi:hypothetical protein LTR95_010873 [Oleoguttula sp. CCFEE 5521]
MAFLVDMDNWLAEQGPPPYEAEPSDDCVICSKEHLACTCEPIYPPAEEHKSEAHRLRNFMLHCLCVDYKYDRKPILSTADRELYLTYQDRILVKLGKKHDDRGEHVCELVYKQWVGRHIDEPSRAMGIPRGVAQTMLYRFVTGQNSQDSYTSSLEGVLERKGVSHLAEKMWIDRNLILPRLKAAPSDVERLRACISASAVEIFVRLDGVTCDCRHDGPLARDSYGMLVAKLSYKLTERGTPCQAAIPMHGGWRYMDDQSLPSTVQSVRNWVGRLQTKCLDQLAEWRVGGPTEGTIKV